MSANEGVITADLGIQHKLRCLPLHPVLHNGVTLIEGSPNLIGGLGAGTPTMAAEISAALELTGIPMDTGDEVYYLVDVQAELDLADLDVDMRLELVFTTVKSSAHGGIDFKGFAKGFKEGALLSDTLVSPDSSMVFPAQSVSEALKIVKAFMPLACAGAFKAEDGTLDELLGVVVELDDKGDGAANELFLVKSRLWYQAEICHPEGVAQSL